MDFINRATSGSLALETTLLVHGLPRASSLPLSKQLAAIARDCGVQAALVGIIRGRATIGLTEDELLELLDHAAPKANTANLGVTLFRKQSAATTVSTTLELAAAAGIRIFATGGLGGIHRGYASHLDISSDLLALSRFPVAVVASGIKSILDIPATREALETLGIPVIGFRTDTFPAFYMRETDLPVDAGFDDVPELAAFVRSELARAGRGILIANPIPQADAITPAEFNAWLAEAQRRTAAAAPGGRDITPALLGHLHDVSAGATLRANISLIKNNTELAAQLCRAMADSQEANGR